MIETDTYQGIEIGPIRPPSEANSLLVRITRNCPWNRCKFCGLYKGQKFSVRSVDHVIQDIDTIHYYITQFKKIIQQPDNTVRKDLLSLQNEYPENQAAFHAALNWFHNGMKSIFLQDANSMIIKPDHMVSILSHLQNTFPMVQRVTSYSRSHTIARISDVNMNRIAKAGLNRIHIGLESACDEVLTFVNKGVDKKTHITAGQKVKRAGIELSEYFMPGLGGKAYSLQNAKETADAMNQINPDFIRIRTLAPPSGTQLFEDVQNGSFSKLNDVQVAQELLTFIESLDGIESTIKSDHILNLIQEVDGTLPRDKEKMIAPIQKFLCMNTDKQLIYRIGRRTGIFANLEDMNNPELMKHVENTQKMHNVTKDNLDQFTDEMMNRFI